MAFFGDLTTLRESGEVAAHRVRAARDACRGGTVVTNPAGLKAWAERRFPESTFFDSAIAEGKFPSTIATFMVSVQNRRTKGDQHAIYVVFGDLTLRRLQ